MSFKLNIGGKMTGNGTTGFGQKASAVIEKCKSMANYMGTLETNVTEAPMNFNAGLRKASADGKLNDSPKFKSAVDASGMNMNDSGMYQRGGKQETIDEGPSGKSSTNRRKMTDAELLAKAKKEGINTATLRKREEKEIARQKANVRNSTVTPNSGNQMATILSAGPNESDKIKKAKEMSRGGKSN
jgi:hypothetical protein